MHLNFFDVTKSKMKKSLITTFEVLKKSLQISYGYECIFPGCIKNCQNFFRWKIHYNKHVNILI